MADELLRILYVSESCVDPQGISGLIQQSRAANSTAGITGVLLFTGGCFLQFLEGPQPAVAETMRRIESDQRHRRLRVLLRENATARRTPQWSMNLVESNTADELARMLLEANEVSAARATQLLEAVLGQS